jgi:hypothetical protein
LLCNYIEDEADRKAFVESMASVTVKKEEVIMRQGEQRAVLARCPACSIMRWSAASRDLRPITGAIHRAHPPIGP